MDSSPKVGTSITSDPDETRLEPIASSDAERDQLTGMRLLFVGDLDPAAVGVDWAAGNRRRLFENADANAWLAELRPALEISVPNHLGGDVERMTFEVTFDSMQVFSRSGLVDRVPALSTASRMRDALVEVQDGKIDRAELQHRLVSAGMAPQTAAELVEALEPGRAGSVGAGESALSRLLGIVDIGSGDGATQAPENPAEAALDAFVGAVAAGTPPDVDPETTGRAITDLEERLARQLNSIFADPQLRRLEAAWRGLKFLLDRADFRGGMRIDVLACRHEDLAEAVHHQILEPEYVDGSERAPIAAVVVDHAFGMTPPDIAILDDLAATGASLQIPFVTAVDAAFFDLDQPTDLAKLGPLRQQLAAEQYIGFRKLRESPNSQFLCLGVPSFLLRDRVVSGSDGAQDDLWGNGALLVGAAMLASHAQTGWPTHLGSRKIENLSIRQTRMGALPAAAGFADRLAMDLAAFGFFAFRAPLNRDHVVASHPAMVGRGGEPAGGGEAAAESTLPAAIFSSLAAHRVIAIQSQLDAENVEQAAAELERRMRSFLGVDLDDDAVTVQHLEEHDDEEHRVFGIRIRPPGSIVPQEFGLVLGASIPRGAE